jgi:hypothetical protein
MSARRLRQGGGVSRTVLPHSRRRASRIVVAETLARDTGPGAQVETAAPRRNRQSPARCSTRGSLLPRTNCESRRSRGNAFAPAAASAWRRQRSAAAGRPYGFPVPRMRTKPGPRDSLWPLLRRSGSLRAPKAQRSLSEVPAVALRGDRGTPLRDRVSDRDVTRTAVPSPAAVVPPPPRPPTERPPAHRAGDWAGRGVASRRARARACERCAGRPRRRTDPGSRPQERRRPPDGRPPRRNPLERAAAT